MGGLTIIQKFALGLVLGASQVALAAPTFKASEIAGQASEIIFCDLDGDDLRDAVLVEGLRFSIFFQGSNGGFSREPQQQFQAQKPGLFWAAQLGRRAESLLTLTSEGLSELCFTNRTNPPIPRSIIKEPTI